MKQPIFTPEIKKCPCCGSTARPVDWNFNSMYAVMCNKCNLTITKECGTKHRAICRWNNRVDLLVALQNHKQQLLSTVSPNDCNCGVE